MSPPTKVIERQNKAATGSQNIHPAGQLSQNASSAANPVRRNARPAGQGAALARGPHFEPGYLHFVVGKPPYIVFKFSAQLMRRFSAILEDRPEHLDKDIPPLIMPCTEPEEFLRIEKHLQDCQLALQDRSHLLHLAVCCWGYARVPTGEGLEGAKSYKVAIQQRETAVRGALAILEPGQKPMLPHSQENLPKHWHHLNRAWEVLGPPTRTAIMKYIGEHYNVYRNAWENDRPKREAREIETGKLEGGVFREAFEAEDWWLKAGLESKRHLVAFDIPDDIELIDANEELKRWEDEVMKWESVEPNGSSAQTSHLPTPTVKAVQAQV